MRKIEAQMNSAISRGANWGSGNTRVEFDPTNETSVVYLHGNLIAIVGSEAIQLFDGVARDQLFRIALRRKPPTPQATTTIPIEARKACQRQF